MSSGWTGPGAKSSPQNESELRTYKALKRRLEAEERDRLTAENERRASLGLKPQKESLGHRAKKLWKRMIM